jgi:hypothetical protein
MNYEVTKDEEDEKLECKGLRWRFGIATKRCA